MGRQYPTGSNTTSVLLLLMVTCRECANFFRQNPSFSLRFRSPPLVRLSPWSVVEYPLDDWFLLVHSRTYTTKESMPPPPRCHIYFGFYLCHCAPIKLVGRSRGRVGRMDRRGLNAGTVTSQGERCLGIKILLNFYVSKVKSCNVFRYLLKLALLEIILR